MAFHSSASHHRTQTTTPPPYRRIIFSFLAAVVGIVLLILYYVLPKAIITLQLEPANEVMEAALTVRSGAQVNEIEGSVMQIEQAGTKNFLSSSAGEREDKATGTVMFVSSYSSPQTLIATTRLLSAQNVLFRLTKTITIPANGKVSAPVIADQGGDASEIAPTKFTVPGLKPGVREKIYAESTDPMRRGEKPGNKVSPIDLEQARKTTSDELTQAALAKLRDQLPADKKNYTVVYQSDITKDAPSVPEGTATATFSYTGAVKVTAVFYDPKTLKTKAQSSVSEDVTLGKSVLGIEEESLAVSIDTITSDVKSAIIKVKFLAKVAITNANQAFNKQDLVGRTPPEVTQYFKTAPGVKSSEIILSPFWVKTVPMVADHITIEIKQ